MNVHDKSNYTLCFLLIGLLSDVGFYEIEADLVSLTEATAVKIYTKTGAYYGFEDLATQWQLVFDGPSSSIFFQVQCDRRQESILHHLPIWICIPLQSDRRNCVKC